MVANTRNSSRITTSLEVLENTTTITKAITFKSFHLAPTAKKLITHRKSVGGGQMLDVTSVVS